MKVAVTLAPMLALMACGAPAEMVSQQPITKTEAYKTDPGRLATCFLAAYSNKYVETYSFERKKNGNTVIVTALRYGTSNDLVLAPRYYWLLEFSPAQSGTTVSLRSLPDQIGIDMARPDIWDTIAACD